MKIQQLNIHAYGKIKDKKIELGDNINLLIGKNESGKSTIMHYILNCFYGISKNKKGKEYSDFDKYLPWSGEDFSGRLKYSLDNGEKYEVYRDFKKRNPKIYNENGEDISNQFNIEKSAGNQFFYEQTKVDEDLFLSTLVSNQQEVKLQKTEQSVLIQKIANLVGTGDDNTSFRIAMDRINRRQLDEVGTFRSREKPINIIDKKIVSLENERDNLEKYEGLQYQIDDNISKIQDNINILEIELKRATEKKMELEQFKIEEEKIKLQEEMKNKNLNKIREYDFQIDTIQRENKDLLYKYGELEANEETDSNEKYMEYENNNKNEKNKINREDFVSENNDKSSLKTGISLIILVIINILQFVLIKNTVIKYILFAILLVIMVSLVFVYFHKQKLKNHQMEEYKEKLKIQNEELKNVEIIKERINLLENEIQSLEKSNLNIDETINEISKKTANSNIKNITLQEIQMQISQLQGKINNSRIELHRLELDKSNIEPQLNRLASIEEEYELQRQKRQELEKLNMSLELAKAVLNDCYETMKNTITPKFTQNLSANIADITNGKYNSVRFNDEIGLIVENEQGDYVPATKLSVGTIEQLYLSLRLSMVDELSEETLPIILDEAFAYFDDERLKNFLEVINKKYANRQILIFSCTEREKEILNELGIDYKILQLNNDF